MHMPDVDQEKAVRERAYFLWEGEGRPEGQAKEHWQRALEENGMEDEDRVLAGRHDANIPAMLTKDVPGG